MRNTVIAILLALSIFPLHDASAHPGHEAALVKGSSSTIYYQAEGGRYVFPDSKTYFSWFAGFSSVQTISDQELATLPLKGMVTYRPGIRLLKIATDPKVYAVDTNGTLRWIQSESLAINLYGSNWNKNIVDVPDYFFINYKVGEPITQTADFNPEIAAAAATTLNIELGLQNNSAAPRAETTVGTPLVTETRVLASDVLPDMVPLSPYDMHYITRDGRTLLTFTATFWNSGAGALELKADHQGTSADGEFEAKQRLYAIGGGFRDATVGTLFWHGVHAHYHYTDFGEYRLERATAIDDPAPVPVFAIKSTFCLRDDLAMNTPALAPRQPKLYNGCQGHTQGVSVGWADIYPYTLPDQNFDVTGLAAGTYKLSFHVDPKGTFIESRTDNNIGATLVELDPAAKKATIIGRVAPFAVSTNTLQDGTRITVEGDNNVYVMYGDRKRKELIPGTGDTYSWPQAAVSAIPDTRFILAVGTNDIYLINAQGWRRKILNPEELASYSYVDGEAAPVESNELALYPLVDF